MAPKWSEVYSLVKDFIDLFVFWSTECACECLKSAKQLRINIEMKNSIWMNNGFLKGGCEVLFFEILVIYLSYCTWFNFFWSAVVKICPFQNFMLGE